MQTESPFVNDGLLFLTIFAAATSRLVYLVTSFFKGVGRDVLVGLSLGAITVVYMSQHIYYDIFKTSYTVFSATNGRQVLEFMNDILAKIREKIFGLLLLLLLVPLILFFVLSTKGTGTQYRYSWMERGVAAGVMTAFVVLALAGIHLGDKEQASAYDMYYKNNHPEALLMGVDIFSDTDPVVIFSNRSFLTDKGRYNSVTRELIPQGGSASS